jgi:hypothetical protein
VRYRVLIDDNYHHADPQHRYRGPEFATLDEAVAHCRRIVDECLSAMHRPGMSVDELMAQYVMFGEDPFIIGGDGVAFSAREYAEEAAPRICEAGGGRHRESVGNDADAAAIRPPMRSVLRRLAGAVLNWRRSPPA